MNNFKTYWVAPYISVLCSVYHLAISLRSDYLKAIRATTGTYIVLIPNFRNQITLPRFLREVPIVAEARLHEWCEEYGSYGFGYMRPNKISQLLLYVKFRNLSHGEHGTIFYVYSIILEQQLCHGKLFLPKLPWYV